MIFFGTLVSKIPPNASLFENACPRSSFNRTVDFNKKKLIQYTFTVKNTKVYQCTISIFPHYQTFGQTVLLIAVGEKNKEKLQIIPDFFYCPLVVAVHSLVEPKK